MSMRADGNTMYFASDRNVWTGIAIYRFRRVGDDSWSAPELAIKGLVGEPALTADGTLLYFVHLLRDAQGIFDADIWYARHGSGRD
ncbi:MAG: PD40 domain-containing protein [Candidatus Schekmanbacteria bacterium]|nr:PD40 domain-containing protein [Candidatus Schekmanbacteria bacterium]